MCVIPSLSSPPCGHVSCFAAAFAQFRTREQPDREERESAMAMAAIIRCLPLLRVGTLPRVSSLPLSRLGPHRAAGFRAPRLAIRTIRCAASSGASGDVGGGQKKVSSRLSVMQQIMQDAEDRALSASNDPIPKITLDHVTVSYARSGGPGGQNVNKVNTKVDMRFNVKNAHWLSERVRERILQMEKNRINKDGEIVISSTKTRTQKGNIEDALLKLQAIIDAASYVAPPPSEEQKKRIQKLAAKEEQRRIQNKKALSQKKAIRRSRDSWD